MRPKLVALLAVPVLALAGCSTAESAPAPAETPTASAVQSVSERKLSNQPLVGGYDANSDLTPEEYGFAVFAKSQAEGAAEEVPTVKESVEALHDFCSSGVSFDLYEDEELNLDMSDEASSLTCDALANPQRPQN